MPEAVLVDGYNVLHAIPRFAPRGGDVAAARDTFERWLADVAARHAVTDVVIVWDGRHGARGTSRGRGVRVLYTESTKTADERILELCRGEYADRAGSTWVISSDHGIQRPARELGFTPVGAMTFFRRWSAGGTSASGSGGRRRRAQRASGAEADPRPTRAEVDELLGELLARREDEGGGS